MVMKKLDNVLVRRDLTLSSSSLEGSNPAL